MMVSRHKAMQNYIASFPPLSNGYLGFNYIENVDGTQSIATVQQDTPIYDILGNKLVQYDFAVVLVRNVSTSTDSVNTDVMDYIDNWIDWIEYQNHIKNLPDFGEGFLVESIENLNNIGELSQVYDNGTGKYMFLCRVNYIQKGA